MPTPKVLILTGDAGESHEVSARAWPEHPAWMREFLRLLRKRAPVSEREAAGVR